MARRYVRPAPVRPSLIYPDRVPVTTESLKQTPLHDAHVEAGARMVPFSGWDMPVQYPAGIISEVRSVRTSAGMFDVSHMARIEFSGPLYEPSPTGKGAFIHPVLEHGEITDLVAWAPDRPGRWAQRLDIGFALGLDAIDKASWGHHPEPLGLYATPLAWLRAGCTGACLLRPTDAWRRLNHLARVTVADVRHGTAIERLLSPPMPRPEILVRGRLAA